MVCLNKWIQRSIPWLTLCMVVITFTIVILRYVFERGWVWMQDIVMYLHAFTFLLAASYTLSRDEHVRVDIFYRTSSKIKKTWINLIGNLLLLLPMCIVLAYYSVPYVIASWSVLEGSKDGGGLEAVFILKSAIPIFSLLLGLQSFAIVLKCLKKLRNPA